MQSDIKLPEGWVLQDKVPARPRFDFGWVDVESERFCLICRVEDYPAPVESPDDWVPQKSVYARPGIDQRRYVRKSGAWCSEWADCACMSWHASVMFGSEFNLATIELRCLRKHHPDYQAKQVDPPTFRIGDTVRFRGGMISFLVAWIANDGMVRLADHSNPAYWCKPETIELVSRGDVSR